MTTLPMPPDHTYLTGLTGCAVLCLECQTECHIGFFWCACCRARRTHRCSNDCEHAIRAVDNYNQRWTGGRPS